MISNELDKFQFIEQNKSTPTEKSVGVISLFSAYQIFVFSDSRGRLSLQGIANILMRSSLWDVLFILNLIVIVGEHKRL